jgi:uncharacterized damage-inducible protein DinB
MQYEESMSLSIPAEKLVLWNDLSAQRWRDLIIRHPEILAIPCDIRNSQSVAQVMQHIVAVELRYAERLQSVPESDYASIPCDTAEAIFATHSRALDMVKELLADGAYDWTAEIDFKTLSMGMLRSSRSTILIHMLMHSIRHYAQLATLVRSHGFTPDWPMDYLFVEAKRVA